MSQKRSPKRKRKGIKLRRERKRKRKRRGGEGAYVYDFESCGEVRHGQAVHDAHAEPLIVIVWAESEE